MLLRPAPAASARRAARGAALRHRGALQQHRALASADDDADAADAAAPAAMRKRRLIVLRHAAAEPRGAPDVDAARALSARGKRDARAVARQLAERSKWLPDLIITSGTFARRMHNSARTRQTLAEMRAEVPEIAKARVIEVRDFYSAGKSGSEALAALNAALARHATNEDATALVLGHNPGWAEAVALLTSEAEAAMTAEESGAAELRTAQGALLRSEHRSWGEALASAWTPRGDVAPPQRRAIDGGPPDVSALAAEEERPLNCAAVYAAEQLPCSLPPEADALGLRRLGHAQDMLRRSDVGAAVDLAAAKHPTQLSDAELTVAIARAERALPPLPREVWRALALAPEERHLDAIAPQKGRNGKATSGDADDEEAARLAFAAAGDGVTMGTASSSATKRNTPKGASKAASKAAVGAGESVSFAHFYRQSHVFSAAELAAARVAVDAYLALRPEMLRRLVDRHAGGPALQEFLQWGWVPEALGDADRFCCMEQQYAGDGRKERELRWTGYAVDGAAVRAARAARQAALSSLDRAPGGAAFAPRAGAPAAARRGLSSAAAARSPSFADVERWWEEQSLVRRGKLRARLEARRRAAADPYAIAVAVAQVWKAQALAQAAAARPAVTERGDDGDASAEAEAAPDAAAVVVTLENPAVELASGPEPPQPRSYAYAYSYVQPESVPRPGESVAARARREAAEAAAAAMWALECVRAAWQSQV